MDGKLWIKPGQVLVLIVDCVSTQLASRGGVLVDGPIVLLHLQYQAIKIFFVISCAKLAKIDGSFVK